MGFGGRKGPQIEKKKSMNFERAVIKLRISTILVLYLSNTDCLKLCFGHILLRLLKMRGTELSSTLFSGYLNFLQQLVHDISISKVLLDWPDTNFQNI